MSDIDRVLHRAAWRLALDRLGFRLVTCLTTASAAMLALRVVERVFGVIVSWGWAWVVAVLVAVAAAVVWTYLARPGRLAVARLVDQGAALRETISTAECVRGERDPWSVSTVEQAGVVARRVVLRDAVPITVPRTWPVPVVLAGLFFLGGLLPQWDVLSLLDRRTRVETQRAEIIQARNEVKAMDDRLEELLKKASLDTPDGEKPETPDAPATPISEPQSPEEIRLDQMKKLTAMDERLSELREGDKARAMDEMKQRLAELRQPEGGPQELQAMSQALQRGDLKQANAELSKLMTKAASNQLTEEQKKQLSKGLESLSKQLENLARDREELEKQLKEAGLDPKLASDPDALKKAMEQASGMSPEHKKALEQASRSAKEGGQKLDKLAKAMSKASQQGTPDKGDQQKPGAGQAGQMGELGDQLSQLEMAEAEVAAMDAAQQEVRQQLQRMGQGKGGEGQGDRFSQSPTSSDRWMNNARRGPGRASGGHQRAVEAEFNLEKQKVKSPNLGGPIIGNEVIEGGEQVKGEAARKFDEAVSRGSKAAGEAIENKQVPREYHEVVKNYFGRLEKKAKPVATPTTSKTEGQPAPESKPDSKPAPSEPKPPAPKR